MDKKLSLIVNSMIIPFIKDKFPKWEQFIKGYFQYLDQACFDKIINISSNNNPFEIYEVLLDDYLNTYFRDVIDIEKYGLTDENKRLFISLSKFIAGMKGNSNSFEFLFRSLKDFRFQSEGGEIDIGSIDINYYDTESWWSTGNPYTYRFTLDQSFEVMKALIDSLHPAGFLFEFMSSISIEDEQGVDDEIDMTVTRISKYDGDKDYDGEIQYGENVIDTLIW